MRRKADQRDDVLQAVKRLGQRLRTERTAKAITQAEMAALLGVSIPSYRALEAGRGTTALWMYVSACLLLDLEI